MHRNVWVIITLEIINFAQFCCCHEPVIPRAGQLSSYACLIQVSFTITSGEMMLYDTKWYVPTTEYKVYVGGQQPNQEISAPSNVLDGSFTVQ